MMIKYEFPFSIYREVVSDDDMHFGLWDDTTKSLEDAQQSLSELLLSFIPASPKKILDVGCGFGKFSSILAKRGHRVIGLDTDKAKILHCQQKYSQENLAFFNKDFMEDDLERVVGNDFDLILFFESTQYFDDLARLFEKCRSMLRESGNLLFCDEMVYGGEDGGQKGGVKSRDRYIVALSETGFRVLDNKKLGEKTKRTCSAVLERLKKLPETDDLKALIKGWQLQKLKHETGQWGYELFNAKKDSYSMCGYVPGSENEILEMFREVFQASRTIDHWRWKYLKCPFGNRAVAVCRDHDKKIVAHFSGYYVPVEDVRNGRLFNVLQAGDTMTRPEVRGVGVGRTSLFARTGTYFFSKYCRGKMPFVYGFNTGAAQRLGELVLNYEVVSPVGYLIKKICGGHRELASYLGGLLYTVKEIDSFDSRYDELYQRIKGQYGGLLIKRDSRYLNWRFRDPDRDYKILELRHRIAGLVGYIVLTITSHSAFIGDVFIDRNYLDALNQALFWLQRRYRMKETALWLSDNPSWLKRYFLYQGFSVDKEPDGLGFVMLSFDPRYNVDKIRGELFYTKADSDLF